jgi:hypothetical protein
MANKHKKGKPYNFKLDPTICYHCKINIDFSDESNWYDIAGVMMCAKCATTRFVKLVEAWASKNKMYIGKVNRNGQ